MRNIFLLLNLVLLTRLYGQPFSAAQQSLINAEKSFAGMSKSKNTRDAFVAYSDAATTVFDNGKPVPALDTWTKRKPDSTLLFWWPVFVGISADGNLGFSTGPWEWSKDRDQAKPQGYGYYATVWKRGKDGNWKMAVDLGISFPESMQRNPPLSVSPLNVPVNKQDAGKARQELLSSDQAYNSQLEKSSVSFLPGHFTNDGHLLRVGFTPADGPENFKSINESGQSFRFTTIQGGIADSGDLGYTYGSVAIELMENGAKTEKHKSFMRVWKRQGTEWKIVLDVINR